MLEKEDEYQELIGVSRQMATIDLTQLVKNGIFSMSGKVGAAVVYRLTND
jgi:L-serine deaminase